MNALRYEEPFFWWGPAWENRDPRGIADLLRDGTIDPSSAAVLWAALARGSGVAVVAGPSGLGKTTLLTALLDFLPERTRRIYIRGCFETFAFLTDQAVVPERTALLVNEISPHLPVYLWGPGVSRLLDAAERGFTVLATAHAASIQEFVASLAGSPLRIPAPRIAAFACVVVLEACLASASGRRIGDLWLLCRTRDGVRLHRASPHTASSSSTTVSDTSASPLALVPVDELAERSRVLIDLRERRIAALPAERWVMTPAAATGAP